MKTKEIDVWVDHDFSDPRYVNAKINSEIDKTFSTMPFRAKLIIELPEPRIEITPSQLEKAIYKHSKSITSIGKNNIIKELFGELDEL